MRGKKIGQKKFGLKFRGAKFGRNFGIFLFFLFLVKGALGEDEELCFDDSTVVTYDNNNMDY